MSLLVSILMMVIYSWLENLSKKLTLSTVARDKYNAEAKTVNLEGPLARVEVKEELQISHSSYP